VRVGGYSQTWRVDDDKSLEAALAWRDDRGGAIFWLTPDDREYPALAIRVTGDLADVHYFPLDGHPGFRCLGGDELPEGGLTTLLYPGCDPTAGEETPNEFVVPLSPSHEPHPTCRFENRRLARLAGKSGRQRVQIRVFFDASVCQTCVVLRIQILFSVCERHREFAECGRLWILSDSETQCRHQPVELTSHHAASPGTRWQKR
jgi:hypothetical protein